MTTFTPFLRLIATKLIINLFIFILEVKHRLLHVSFRLKFL